MSKIPSFVCRGNKGVRGAFIRGFADSEGSVDDTNNRHQIVITQKGTERLESVRKLLSNLSIQSKIYKKKSDSNHLVISLFENLKKFENIIGFSINYKKQKLRTAVEFLGEINLSNLYWEALRRRIKSDKSSERLAKELGLKFGTFKSWISSRRIPRQIKKDIEFGKVPKDYKILRDHFKFLPKDVERFRLQRL